MIFYTYEYAYNFSIEQYDKDKDMLKGTQEIISFFCKKHRCQSIETSLNFALFLLNQRSSEHTEYACRMLKRIFKEQIKNTQSEYYGIWLYGFSDSTEDYILPDYPSQSSILVLLIEIYMEFKDYLPDDIINSLRECSCISAFVLSQHSHEIDSVNALIEIFAMVSLGEQLNKQEYVHFGLAKMQTLVYYMLYNGTYNEYNHASQILKNLNGIKYFRNKIKNEQFLSSVDNIEKTLLGTLFSHFNFKTKQWTGPLSSAISDFFPERSMKLMQSIFETRDLNTLKIPSEYVHLSPSSGKSFNQHLCLRGFSYPHWKFATVASFYNADSFSLGTFNREELWERRRPLIAYFGTEKAPYCLRVRCLLNGYDFSSATLHTVQYKGNVLGHITFSVNRGNLHLSLDHQDSYQMNDFRIRFQITGDSSAFECRSKQNDLSILYKSLAVHFNVNYAVFDNYRISYQFSNNSDAIFFDTIIYSGEEIPLKLSEIEKAIISFSLDMNENGAITTHDVKSYEEQGFLMSEQKLPDVSLKLKTPQKPDKIEYITLFDRQYINDVRIETHVDINRKISGQYKYIVENRISPNSTAYLDNSENSKAYLDRIKALENIPLEEIDSHIESLTNDLNNFSVDLVRRYSIHIISKLFDSANRGDIRFKNIISKKYTSIYDEITYTAKADKMKKIISNLTNSLMHDYKHLLTTKKKIDIVNSAMSIIENNYSNPNLSLQSIAYELDVSQAHLSREFHSIVGKGYADYLLATRIEHAKKLLSDGHPTKVVMEKCGYISDVTFTSAFKRYTDTTPKKYIKSIQT